MTHASKLIIAIAMCIQSKSHFSYAFSHSPPTTIQQHPLHYTSIRPRYAAGKAILPTFRPSSKILDRTNKVSHSSLQLNAIGRGGGDKLTTIASSSQDILASLFATEGLVPIWQAAGINAALFVVLSSKLSKMLTPEGFAHSFALGTLLWATLGWKGWTVCVAYLFFGQLVTKIRFEEKEKKGIAEARGGRRGPENVWGSALTGLICAACSAQGATFLGIERDIFVLAYVSSLATKLGDTFGSEIGKAYGKTTFLITTFKKVPAGTEGAVSAEGTAATVVGGAILALFAYALKMITLPGVLIATVSAFIACNCESLIGATIQEKKGFDWMTNEVVNFFNTLIGAGLSIIAGMMLL